MEPTQIEAGDENVAMNSLISRQKKLQEEQFFSTMALFINKHFHHSLQRQSHIRFCACRRIVVSSSEPPLDSDVIERPFSLILMEDHFMYSNSWKKSFHDSIPKDHGMSFAYLLFPEQKRVNELLDGLITDIAQIPDAVVVARGPRSSWIAQLYLESLYLRGLVMVDPIMLDRPGEVEDEAIAAISNDLSTSNLQTGDVAEWSAFVQEAQDRVLRLEPSSIPMLVLNSHQGLLEASKYVANRHSDRDGPYGEVPIVKVDDSPEHHQKGIIAEIDGWIDTIY